MTTQIAMLDRNHRTRARRAIVASAIVLAGCLVEASASAKPAVLNPVTIVPIYYHDYNGTPVNPEVQEVLPSFYSDFASQYVPNGIGAVLKEYGAGQAISLDLQYTNAFQNVYSTPTPALADLQALLEGAMQSPSILPLPACAPPQSGNQAFSNFLYVIHLAPGDNLAQNAGGCGAAGYHNSAFITQNGPHGAFSCNFAFATVVDVTPNNGNTCDVAWEGNITANGLNFGMINDYTYVLSHELIEAIVNPFTGPNPEVGDRCQNATTGLIAPWSTMPSNSGPPWLIASTWSVANNTCWVSEQSLGTGNTGYTPIPNTTIVTWTWDDESYKSSGFAIARGPSHMDVFSSRGTEGGTEILTTVWDPATQLVRGDAPNWVSVDDSWRANTEPPPAIPQSPETLESTPNIAAAGSPVTAVSPTATSIFAFVAGSDGQVYEASCVGGDGCRTTGSWTDMSAVVPASGSYTIAPGTPIAVVSPSNLLTDPLTLFFAGTQGELFELQDLVFAGWTATKIAPSGTLPITPTNALGHPFVSAFARYEVLTKKYVYEVFAAGPNGEILWYNAPAGTPPFSNSVITGSAVQPGTQIASLTRVPGQIDLFAVDSNGAVQSYWWNELLSPPGWNHVANLMPASTANPGAGIAAVGWADHMNVFTTTSSSGGTQGLVWQAFEELSGWNSTPTTQGASFTPGVPLQAVSPYRDRADIFGLESNGTVDWQAWSTQFLGITQASCNLEWDCGGTQVQ